MAQNSDPRDVINVLSKRGHILEYVFKGVQNRSELVDKVEESRSTVYRSLSELEDAGIVEEFAGEYEPTFFGEFVFEEYKRFDKSVNDIQTARDLLMTLPSANAFNPEAIKGADIIKPTRQEPDRPIQALKQAITNASSLKGIAPTTLLLDIVCKHSLTGISTGELLVEETSLQYFEQKNAEKLNQIWSNKQFDVYEKATEIPFGLILVEDDYPTMIIVVYNRQGELKGLIRNNSERAISWAMEVYHRRVPTEQAT